MPLSICLGRLAVVHQEVQILGSPWVYRIWVLKRWHPVGPKVARLLHARATKPSVAEVARNPRARSARRAAPRPPGARTATTRASATEGPSAAYTYACVQDEQAAPAPPHVVGAARSRT